MIFAIIFSSVFLPRIKVEITIQPQYQSVAKAEKKDNNAIDKPHCVVFSGLSSQMKRLSKILNRYYGEGYSLKGFSTAPSGGISISEYTAVVCKE
ncbi:MAG: hypothetical protein KI793_14175 [Rivularia sp. (in: Bacteria)]|nr:hypothetical protein [Rivularia sp. MS3]